MPNDLLIEIGTEELPPKSLKRLIDSFAASFEEGLNSAQLEFGSIQSFATPRRLALLVVDLANSQPSQTIEKKGPSLKAALDDDGEPTKAVLGFMRSCGLTNIDDLQKVETNKGTWLIYKSEKTGATLEALLPEILGTAINKLPIDRKMRWGANRIEFVRPVQWIVALYGNETKCEIFPLEILGLQAGNVSRGHRFMSDGDIAISCPAAYQSELMAANVVVDFAERRALISEQLERISQKENATIVIDPALLDEVTALVEWPVALVGKFDPEFLSVPEEALISAMKSHQRYFHLVDSSGKLLPMFVTISNIESTNPTTVINGNERVIAPRLSDARFFFTQDHKSSLEDKLARLRKIVFQSRLGTYHDKVTRISQLSAFIAQRIGADSKVAERAGLLCKSDLVSDMVGEFPELQGVMGAYYALHDGEIEGVAEAIRDHYKPTQSGADLPLSLVGQCVSIADKVDNLTGLFGIGQPPTGSKDPFALRRQTLGIIRICIEKNLDIDMNEVINRANQLHEARFDGAPVLNYMQERMGTWYQGSDVELDTFLAIRKSVRPIHNFSEANDRIESLQKFRSHPRAKDLISANKRIANILRKSDYYDLKSPDPKLFVEDIESTLFNALLDTRIKLTDASNIESQFILLADFQVHIACYFEDVMVIAEDVQLKENRLATLQQLRALFLNVADFSVLQE